MSRPKDVPVKRVIITDPKDIPNDCGRTPGGTLYGTTPGGTKIIYERQVLLDLRSSPLSRSPPANMIHIPGITYGILANSNKENGDISPRNDVRLDDQFSMDEDYIN